MKFIRNLISSICIFTFTLLIFSTQESLKLDYNNRRLIILLERTKSEGIDITLNSDIDRCNENSVLPEGIGAITGTLLIALEQQAAPILLSNELFVNLLEHKNLFDRFLYWDINELYDYYSNYLRFKDYNKIKNFKQSCIFYYKNYQNINNYLKEILSNKLLSKNAIIDNVIKKFNFNNIKLPDPIKDIYSCNINYNLYLEINIFIICYEAASNLKNYIIKKANDNLVLLIPKKYLLDNNFNFYDISYNNSIGNHQLTKIESDFGLKLNHMPDIYLNKLNIEKFKIENENFNFVESLDNIFVTKEDIKNNNIKKNRWCLYCAGHGLPKCVEKNFLDQLLKLEKYYESKINNLKNIKDSKKLISIRKEIKKLKRCLDFYCKNNDLNLGSEIIISLSKDEFRNFLKFLNEKIYVNTLYYTSCYAGGTNLFEPYIDNNKDLILNYDVICGTLSENLSMQELPFFRIAPYKKDLLKINHIDFNRKCLKFCTTLHFDKYFKAMSKQYNFRQNLKNLVRICQYLQPYTDKFGNIEIKNICNIPSIRYKNTNNFVVIVDDKDTEIINNNKKNINLNKSVVLLYDNYIGNTINIRKIPKCIHSMNPGSSAHVIENIIAKNYTIEEIIEPFLFFQELTSPKIFWIKNITCLNNIDDQNNKYINLKNLIITRKTLTIDKIIDNTKCKGLSYIAYFERDDNFQYKIKFFEDYTEIDPCLHQYKKDLLVLNPDIKKYVDYWDKNISTIA